GCRAYILHALGQEDHAIGKGVLVNFLRHGGLLDAQIKRNARSSSSIKWDRLISVDSTRRYLPPAQAVSLCYKAKAGCGRRCLPHPALFFPRLGRYLLLRQLGLNGLGNLFILRLDPGFKASNDLAVATNQELRKVPLDRASKRGVRLLGGEILVEGDL